MNDERDVEHESFGLLSFSRIQSNMAKHLFGSSIKHQNTIMMRVNTAVEHRGLNRFWYHERKTLIEIELSYSQFAEAITSMNTSGIPCTIRYVQGEGMEDCPGESQRELFESEFKTKVNGVTDILLNLKNKTGEILNKKGTLKVSEKEEVYSLINKIIMEVRSNLPFIQRSYNEALDKTTMEAKSEIESFINHKITSMGLEAFRSQFEQIELDSIVDAELIEDNSDKEGDK